MVEELIEADPVVVFHGSGSADAATDWIARMLSDLSVVCQPFELDLRQYLRLSMSQVLDADKLPLRFVDATSDWRRAMRHAAQPRTLVRNSGANATVRRLSAKCGATAVSNPLHGGDLKCLPWGTETHDQTDFR